MDDEPQQLQLLRNTLSNYGYKPYTTSNPDEMMRFVETKRPHLVLLDLILPGTNGFELMKAIRWVSDAPIIFLSASGRREEVSKALSMGADDYVTKPFSTKPFSATELVARIEPALRKREAVDAAMPNRCRCKATTSVPPTKSSVPISSASSRSEPRRSGLDLRSRCTTSET